MLLLLPKLLWSRALGNIKFLQIIIKGKVDERVISSRAPRRQPKKKNTNTPTQRNYKHFMGVLTIPFMSLRDDGSEAIK